MVSLPVLNLEANLISSEKYKRRIFPIFKGQSMIEWAETTSKELHGGEERDNGKLCLVDHILEVVSDAEDYVFSTSKMFEKIIFTAYMHDACETYPDLIKVSSPYIKDDIENLIPTFWFRQITLNYFLDALGKKGKELCHMNALITKRHSEGSFAYTYRMQREEREEELQRLQLGVILLKAFDEYSNSKPTDDFNKQNLSTTNLRERKNKFRAKQVRNSVKRLMYDLPIFKKKLTDEYGELHSKIYEKDKIGTYLNKLEERLYQVIERFGINETFERNNGLGDIKGEMREYKKVFIELYKQERVKFDLEHVLEFL